MSRARYLKFDEAQLGEDVVRRSHRLKLDLWHVPADEDKPAHMTCNYELHGGFEVEDANDAATVAFLRNLLFAFRNAERETEGGAEC